MTRVTKVHQLEVPQYLQDHLTRIGGTNLYGEPNFRLVWSGSRVTYENRKWHEPATESSAAKTWYGIGRVLKYRQPARRERYIVEVWRPPSYYGDPQTWMLRNSKWEDGRSILATGPFPTRGDYEYLDTVESVDADGSRHFLCPTEAYLDTVVTLYHVLLETPAHVIYDQKQKEDAAKKEADYNWILERVTLATDPKFRPAMAAFNNTSHLAGSAEYIARNAEAIAL